MERWFRSLKSECLSGMIFFGVKSLAHVVCEYVVCEYVVCEYVVCEYVGHYHVERNHQGRGNELIAPNGDPEVVAGRIKCRERLGGMLKYYHRRAA